ncbi:hypothetical protein STVIR_1294 [Streptomyces viridochromogenes Tue57]|uniref:Uncharacterized protein n=1 Tax=Streptomyces viridochromogenes Tue57 TaxID=1160705 RepID=L8PMH3_STRVR|nr:hypothetical protein STVIR_1294 [Streptomyces viridochromogenes Tue57]
MPHVVTAIGDRRSSGTGRRHSPGSLEVPAATVRAKVFYERGQV